MTKYKNKKGFIALFSSIIISALLLYITVSLGFSEFFGRLNIADAESKEISHNLAESCVNQAILNLAKEIVWTGIFQIDSDQCTIASVETDSPQTGQTTIKSQAAINKSYSNLKYVIDNSDFSVVFWTECANLNSC